MTALIVLFVVAYGLSVLVGVGVGVVIGRYSKHSEINKLDYDRRLALYQMDRMEKLAESYMEKFGAEREAHKSTAGELERVKYDLKEERRARQNRSSLPTKRKVGKPLKENEWPEIVGDIDTDAGEDEEEEAVPGETEDEDDADADEAEEELSIAGDDEEEEEGI